MRYVENENKIILVIVVFIFIFSYKCSPVVLMILNFNKVSLVLYIIQYLALQGVHDTLSSAAIVFSLTTIHISIYI